MIADAGLPDDCLVSAADVDALGVAVVDHVLTTTQPYDNGTVETFCTYNNTYQGSDIAFAWVNVFTGVDYSPAEIVAANPYIALPGVGDAAGYEQGVDTYLYIATGNYLIQISIGGADPTASQLTTLGLAAVAGLATRA